MAMNVPVLPHPPLIEEGEGGRKVSERRKELKIKEINGSTPAMHHHRHVS